jgi:signal recognition particle subunit SRP68
VIAESLQRQSESTKEILWNGNRVPLKNDKVRMYILNAQEASYELERTQAFENKMPLYDKLFIAYNDAIRVTKDDITAAAVRVIFLYELMNTQAKKGGQEEGLNLLKNYISFLKATKTIERNLLMADVFEQRLQANSGKLILL